MLVHYAGWTDKLQPVLGGINPVAAPFLSFSVPEPTGVVGVDRAGRAAAARSRRRAGARACRRQHRGRGAVRTNGRFQGLDLGEVMGIADVPGGVVNLLSGRRAELAPAARRPPRAERDRERDAATHALGAEIDKLAAESVTRVRHAPATDSYADATADPLSRLEAVTELKTAWHPVGA